MEFMVSMRCFSRSNFLPFNRKQNMYESHLQSSDGTWNAKVDGTADKGFFRMTSLISSEQLRLHDSALSQKYCLSKNLFTRCFESSSARGRIILPVCALLSLKRKLKSSLMLSQYEPWKNMTVGRLLRNRTISIVKIRNIYRNMQPKQKQQLRGPVRGERLVVRKCWWRLGLSCVLAAGLCLFLQVPMGNCLGPKGSQALDCFNDAVNYYKGTEGLKGRALKLKLHKIVDGHLALSYAQVWDALKILDAVDETSVGISSKVVEIYSLRKVSNNLAGKLNGWNREHLWPHSYGLRRGYPEFTDLHNLRPADLNVNSSRGNKYFGDCIERHSSDCRVPANREAASDTATDKESWRPPTQVRGDIARALMYMAVRYGSDDLGGIPLRLSDTPCNAKAEMGLLSVLMQWNSEDPPSPSEKLRNVRVCSLYQHNRNPFVDYPQFSLLIWGPEFAQDSF